MSDSSINNVLVIRIINAPKGVHHIETEHQLKMTIPDIFQSQGTHN
jgi:hypothetical protein